MMRTVARLFRFQEDRILFDAGHRHPRHIRQVSDFRENTLLVGPNEGKPKWRSSAAQPLADDEEITVTSWISEFFERFETVDAGVQPPIESEGVSLKKVEHCNVFWYSDSSSKNLIRNEQLLRTD